LIDLIGDILYLASALGVLTCVVLFALNPLYAIWLENKYNMDLEGELYESISEAIEEALESGLDLKIKISVGESQIEKAEKESTE
jgi:hypothetical protein